MVHHPEIANRLDCQKTKQMNSQKRERTDFWQWSLALPLIDTRWLFHPAKALASALLQRIGGTCQRKNSSRSIRINKPLAKRKFLAGRKASLSRWLIAEPLEPRIVLDAYMVRDINVGGASSSPSSLVQVESTFYFSANQSTSGIEFWKSDGTEAGTARVKAFALAPPGGAGSSFELTNVNGTLFFRANDGTSGSELWKSDGTEAGTVLVKDIWPGIGGAQPQQMANIGGTLFFAATNSNATGIELWKSDGTQAGTILVKDIRPGTGSSFPSELTNVNGTLYFRANDGTSGYELWKSDGTEAGTVRVKDIRLGNSSSYPTRLTNIDGTLFFTANDGTSGGLWKSDGTESGTVRLQGDIEVGGAMRDVDGTLFFSGYDATSGVELWKSDGTEAGTVRVKDIWPGSSSSIPSSLANVGGTLFFGANDGTSGRQLWKSDGTEAGTVLVKWPGSLSPIVAELGRLTNVDGTLYFRANDGTSGVELWKSDGTEAGTVRVTDILPGFSGSFPNFLTNVNGKLFFAADDGLHGTELWSVDVSSTAEVVGSSVYHKGSSFAEGGVANALDTGKQLAKEAAVPQALGYNNLINSNRGINGLVFDISGLPASSLTAADFEFQMSPTGAFDQQQHPPHCWPSAPSPSSISVQAGDVSRLVLEWPDNAIANRWLRVTLNSTDNTGLSQAEVYYLGHLLGETTGPTGGVFTVAFADISPIRSAVGQTVDASSIVDIDKNGTVSFADISAMRSSVGTQLTNITIPASGGSCSAGAALNIGSEPSKQRTAVINPFYNYLHSNILAPGLEALVGQLAPMWPERSEMRWVHDPFELPDRHSAAIESMRLPAAYTPNHDWKPSHDWIFDHWETSSQASARQQPVLDSLLHKLNQELSVARDAVQTGRR